MLVFVIVSGPLRRMQVENVLFPMDVTLAGIVRAPVRLMHPKNAPSPMEVTDAPIVRAPARLARPKNAFTPMEVTVYGVPLLVTLLRAVEGILDIFASLFITDTVLLVSIVYVILPTVKDCLSASRVPLYGGSGQKPSPPVQVVLPLV